MPLDWKLSNALAPPREQESLLKSISDLSPIRGGCFDVFAWRNDEVVFCEAKRQHRDRIRESQRRWIEAAISVGLRKENLLIVEWHLSDDE